MSELPEKTVTHIGTYDDSWHEDDPDKCVEDLRKAQFYLNRLEDER